MAVEPHVQSQTAESQAPPPAAIADSEQITPEELQLAARNHGMPLEGLRYDVTPVGMHYLLIHFDIPFVDASTWRVSIGGHVERESALSLDEIRRERRVTMPVTLECAGNGRARLSPRPLSQPWLNEAVGTAEWTGTPLKRFLERAGVRDGAVEVVFTGLDRGVQGGVEHDYERSLPLEEALRDDVLLVYEINGQPLPPQHGFPVRLVVPGWYGMTSVKWLSKISVVTQPFEGYQQAVAYRLKQTEEEQGEPVTRMNARALMIPPGIPDFFSRVRIVRPGRQRLEGRAWSGWAAIQRVEVSTDGGVTWADADVAEQPSRYAWVRWSHAWDARPGEYELTCRATDAAGNTQPIERPWNLQGLANNMVQRIRVVVEPQ